MASASSEWISTEEELCQLIGEVGDTAVTAVDTEADSLHRYRESLCLVQFAWGERSVLIDPLAIENLSPLYDMLHQQTVWMHGADYDMTMLKRECGKLPVRVFDTQIGARLLGLRKFGLGNLVEHYFDVVLSKSSQKADWGKRPLSPKMIDYALNDVRYLLPMAEKIETELREKGRYDWFVESCEWAKQKVEERANERAEPWRIQGAGRLDRKGLNQLKHLWEWRDKEAEQWDRPSFMVVTNRQLIDWTGKLLAGERVELPGHYRADRRKRFSEMLAATKETKPEEFPERIRGARRRREKDFEEKVAAWIKHRNGVAEELDIDPSLIASRALLETLACDESSLETQWMNWQKECMGFA